MTVLIAISEIRYNRFHFTRSWPLRLIEIFVVEIRHIRIRVRSSFFVTKATDFWNGESDDFILENSRCFRVTGTYMLFYIPGLLVSNGTWTGLVQNGPVPFATTVSFCRTMALLAYLSSVSRWSFRTGFDQSDLDRTSTTASTLLIQLHKRNTT